MVLRLCERPAKIDVLLLCPFEPHIAEELWVELGHKAGGRNAAGPGVNDEALKRDELQLAGQI